MLGSLVVLTGASGAGTTTLAAGIQNLHRARWSVLFFDSIGIPSAAELDAFGTGHQPGGAWQRHATMQWMDGRILLIDFADDCRITGLADRGQPQLATWDMMNWSGYLREDALQMGCEILDTGALTLPECLERLRSYL